MRALARDYFLLGCNGYLRISLMVAADSVELAWAARARLRERGSRMVEVMAGMGLCDTGGKEVFFYFAVIAIQAGAECGKDRSARVEIAVWDSCAVGEESPLRDRECEIAPCL